MDNYQAPIKDMMFALSELANLSAYSKKIDNKDLSSDNIKMILEEAGKFAGEKLDTINQKGDQEGVSLENGVVRMELNLQNLHMLNLMHLFRYLLLLNLSMTNNLSSQLD